MIRCFKPRDMSERMVLQCELVLQEVAHLGGADPDATSDRPLLRNANGEIYLAGTALKGVLRTRTLSDADLLFGGKNNQACLLVDDAPLMSAQATELRDGVAIDPQLGIAAEKKKYDMELLPAGSRFAASFEVLVPSREADKFRLTVCEVLSELDQGLEVGARTRRGFGLLRRQGAWSIRRYSGQDGLLSWLAEGVDGTTSVQRVSAIESQDLYTTFGVPRQQHSPSRSEVSISLELNIEGSLLIRAPVTRGSADAAHLHALRADGSLVPVLSGTSLAGALRSRCLRIAQTLDADCGAELVDGLFGPAKVASRNKARASRIRVFETPIEGGTTLRHTRVRIDPWTGGASDALLFTSEPIYGGRVAPQVRWQRPEKEPERERAERALLLLVLRDLALGDLRVGGEVATGRGRFRPRHNDGRFGTFGDVELKLTAQGGLAGDFQADLLALRERTWRIQIQ